jgi:hypothetical protein
MRVICCYSSGLHPKAAVALAKYAPDAELVPTLGLYGYNEAIASRWDGSADLVVIEADKEITAAVLPTFESCTHRWCSFGYPIFPMPYTRDVTMGLGCTRYSVEAQRIVSVSEFIRPDSPTFKCPECNGKGCWCGLDGRIATALVAHGSTPHVHGYIEHHHEYHEGWHERARGFKR